jgi:hypothetical protein
MTRGSWNTIRSRFGIRSAATYALAAVLGVAVFGIFRVVGPNNFLGPFRSDLGAEESTVFAPRGDSSVVPTRSRRARDRSATNGRPLVSGRGGALPGAVVPAAGHPPAGPTAPAEPGAADGGTRADESPTDVADVAAAQTLRASEVPPSTSETPLLDLPEPLPDLPPSPVPVPPLPLPPPPETPQLPSVETQPLPLSPSLPLPSVPILP